MIDIAQARILKDIDEQIHLFQKLRDYYSEEKTEASFASRNSTLKGLFALAPIIVSIGEGIEYPASLRVQIQTNYINERRRDCVLDMQTFHLDYDTYKTRKRLEAVRSLYRQLDMLVKALQELVTFIQRPKEL